MTTNTFPAAAEPTVFDPRLPVQPIYPFHFSLLHKWEVPAEGQPVRQIARAQLPETES